MQSQNDIFIYIVAFFLILNIKYKIKHELLGLKIYFIKFNYCIYLWIYLE